MHIFCNMQHITITEFEVKCELGGAGCHPLMTQMKPLYLLCCVTTLYALCMKGNSEQRICSFSLRLWLDFVYFDPIL